MAQRRNLFTAMGRPPKPKAVPSVTAIGEKTGASPMDNFDTRIPASAYKTGGSVQRMPKYHDDPRFCGGGPAKRR
jgi:hypothetical protein